MGEAADGIDSFVIKTIEVGAEKAGERLDWSAAVNRLDDEFLGVLLRLREPEVGHELDGEQGVARGPLGGFVPD